MSAITREVSLWYVRIVVPSFAITVVIRRSNGCLYQKTCSMYLAAFKENEHSDVQMYIQMLNGLYAVQWLSYLHLLHIIILHFIGYMDHAEY